MKELNQMMEQFQQPAPSMPMTGSGRRKLPEQPGQGPGMGEMDTTSYIPPATSDKLDQESASEHPIVTLRRRMDNPMARRRVL